MKYSIIICFSLFICYTIHGQQEAIDIEGGLKLGNTTTIIDGVIQYDGNDFLGRLGGEWKSLTNANSIWSQDTLGNIFYSSGKVGIGIEDPLTPLHMKGVLRHGGNTGTVHTNFNTYKSGSSGGVILQIDPIPENDTASSVVRLFRSVNTTGDAYLMIMKGKNTTAHTHKLSAKYDSYLSIGKRLGVGLTAPRSKLHIANNVSETETANQLRIYDQGTTNGSVYGLGISGSDFDLFAHRNYRFHTLSRNDSRGNEVFTILESGAVGIGTNTPLGRLDIKLGLGAIRTYSTSKYKGLRIYSDTLQDSRSQIEFYHQNSVFASIITGYNVSTSNANLTLRTHQPESNINFNPNSVNRMTVNAESGFIGIGTTSPDANLHISTAALDPGELALRIGGKGDVAIDASGVIGGRMVIKEDGKVGVNTPNPAVPLHTKGFVRASYLTNLNEFVEIGHGGSNGFINTQGDGNLQFRHDGAALMNLKPDGKLFIGNVATPGDYKLYVEKGILTEEVKVAIKGTADWADDAFERTPTLYQMEKNIKQNSHLLDMPSAQELVDKGYSVTDMDAKLLQQIEWSWMHIISMEKQLTNVEKANKTLKVRLDRQDQINTKLQAQIDELKMLLNK